MKKKDRNFSTVHAEINGFVSRVSEAVARSLNGDIVAFPPFENDDKKKEENCTQYFSIAITKVSRWKSRRRGQNISEFHPPPPHY